MDGTPKKYTKVNEQVLKDFAVTLEGSPNLSEKEILAKFPEFENDVNAIQSARDYWATVGDNPTIPKDIATKFPEFDFGGTTPAEKKNEKPATVSPVGGGSSDLPKIKYDGKEYGYNPSTLQVFQADGTELKQVKHLGKTYDVKDYLTNVIGVKPKQVDNTEYDFKTGFADRQQGAISAAQAPDVQSDRLLKRNKKFPSIKNNPQVAAAFDAYDNLKNAAAKTADKQNEYDRFLKTGTFTDESGQDIRPLGAIPTDVLGTTTVVEGSPAAEIKKKLENDLKVAKEDENKAYDDLGNKENTFRNAKLPELPVKKELGADKYEYEMPSQVNVLNFMQGLSNLEDHASGQGLSLKQYSDSVENIAADAFLSPDQQNLFKELNSGDERAARSAIARYDENIDKQINAINKQLALGATPAQKAYLINERTRLTDQKSDFFSPRKAIEAVGTLNPQLKPVFDAFAGIGDQDKASLVYAKVFKDSQDLADELIGQPLFIDQDGKQVINPKVTDYLVGGQDSPFRRKSADKRELLQKNINTLKLLAPATLLNRRPLEKKGSFIESFGKTIAKGIGFDTGFTQTMVETDKPSVIANFLADATVSTKDLPTNQAKQLEQIGKQSNWEFSGSTLGYLIPAGVQLAVGGAELAAMKFITSALKRTSTAADLAYDIIKLTKGSSMLNKAVKMGADAQLGGWTFSDPEMGFANIGAESLAGELFEKAIKKLPGGALVTKVAKKVFADNYITALNKIGKMNAYGLGETTGEFAGSLVQLYQDSDTWNDFYDKFQQQFGKAEENLKFFLSCHSLGMVMGNHAAPATKAVQNAADKAYQKLTPDEKKIADEVIENDVDATNVATVDVLRNNVQFVPDADLKTRIEQVKKAKADLDALPDLKANTQNAGSPYIVPSKQGEVKNAKDGAYEIKVGDITLSGNTPEQLANDKDLINSLYIIYSGEQQRREAEGITVETPPIAEADQGDVELAKPEAGVGVEGEVVPETVQNAQESGQNGVPQEPVAEKELFTETDNKGKTYTYFSYTKEKDGVIKTTFTFNRSDKDASQRNNATMGVPVKKALGNKYTIDEKYIPEGAKVLGVSEIRITEKGAGATITIEDTEGNKYRADVKLNSNTTYDAERAAITTPTTTTQTAPQEGEVKETVEDTQVSGTTNLEEDVFDIDNGFENQRKAGFIVEKGVKTNRKAPVKNKAVGKTVEVDFGLRDNPKAEYTVIEVDDIVPSHKNGQRNPEHFIPEAQPKNRSAAFDKASDNETIEIANNLKPERLAESPNAFSGAPVVNERGEVIQGNNRAESLRKHWLGQGAEYKQYLIDNAERLGINPDDIAKMKAPVLVRMTKVSDEGAIKLGQADVTDLETGGEKRLDPIKTANKIGLKDAKGLIDILADAPQDETLNQTIRRKAEALIDYLFRNGLVTRAQQASMIKNGVIVPRALEDIQNLFTQVLLKGSDPNLASIYENNTPNIVKQAIDKATPILLGLPKNVGITQNIQNALLGLDEFLKTGIDKVKEWANQPDMFNDGLAPQDIYSPLELVMIEQMAKAKRIIDVLNPIKEYAKLVTEQPATLFEEAAQPISKEQALKQVYGTEKSTLGTTERTPRLQEENGGTQQKPSGETTKGEAKSPTDREKTPPTEKVEAEPTADIDNVADKAGIAPKKAKKAAIQSDVIDKLVGKAANRREAYKEIADENIKEVAKIITDTNGKFDKVMDAIDNNDQLLADLEKKLGMKKICRI